MNPAILISGTDTEVGKTRIITALAAYYLQYNATASLGLIKLIQTGLGDLQYYQELFKEIPPGRLDIVAPLVFDTPIAPPLAAMYEGKEINLAHLWQVFSGLLEAKTLVLAEGCGGLGSPITNELTVADLAATWRIPTILVAPVALGTIGQIVANIALARQTGVSIIGIILNCSRPVTPRQMADWAPIDLIVGLTQTAVLGCFPYSPSDTNLLDLAQFTSNLALEHILPRYKLLQ